MINSNHNIKFSYLYRDGANYKQFGQVIFINDKKISVEEIRETIKGYLIDELWFYANKWNIPDLHFTEYKWDEEIDHSWHEFESIEETNEAITDNRSIGEFLLHIKEHAKHLVEQNSYSTSE